MLELGGGMRGGWVVTPAFRKKAPAVQVTRFTETGIPAGHEEYQDLASALAAHFDYLPHPISRLSANTYRDQIKAWEEATFEHPYADELLKKKFVYMSPNRPLAGVWVEGEQSEDKSGNIGVLYRDEPLPFKKIESLQLVPITDEAKYAAALHLAELWQDRVGYSGTRENPFEQPEPPDELYDPVQLAIGTEEELEHTSDRRIAKRIAKDHLEDPLYYQKLKILGLNPSGDSTQFSRLMLSEVFEEVRAVCPDARMNDASATYTQMGAHKYYAVHIGGRPCYGDDFFWEGEAENAYDAKMQTWEAWLRKGR